MKSSINYSLLVKLNFLILGLGLVIYFIYALNTRGLPAPVASLFGATDKLKWCDTRVLAMIRPDEFKVEQVNRKWTVETATGIREANFLAMEKWFVEYCTVPAGAHTNTEPVELEAALVVKFIDGQIEVLKQGAGDLFSWRGQTLSAPKLSEALQALNHLASESETAPMQEIPEESEP